MKRVTLAAFLAAGVLLVGCGGGGGGDGGGNGNGNGNGGDKTAFPTVQKAFPDFNHTYKWISHSIGHRYSNAADFEKYKNLMVEREINSGVLCDENLTLYFSCGDAHGYTHSKYYSFMEGGEFVVTDIGPLIPSSLGVSNGSNMGFDAYRYIHHNTSDEYDIFSLDDLIGGYLYGYAVGKYYPNTLEIQTAILEYADKLENEHGFRHFIDPIDGDNWYVKWDDKYFYKFAYVPSDIPAAIGGTTIAVWDIGILDPWDTRLFEAGFYNLCGSYYAKCDYEKR